jgi:hypothetical protein
MVLNPYAVTVCSRVERAFKGNFGLDEAMAGDPEAAQRRVSALREALPLALTPEARKLAQQILDQGGMPAKAYIDAAHVSLAAVHGLDYLLTWNCAHIANAAMRGKIELLCRAAGFEPPVICTPIELTKAL